MTPMWTTLAEFSLGMPTAALLLILGFSFIIFVHELGHFLVAKAVGIQCTQFAIGFGQALLCYRRGIGFRIGTTEKEYAQRVVEYINGQLTHRSDIDTRFRTLHCAESVPVESLEGAQNIDPKLIEHAANDLGMGETEYRLNWIPFGGYVKMLGQEDVGDQSGTISDNPRSFANQSIGARFAVISAGVIMNAIFAVVFFVIAFMSGVEFPAAVIGPVAPNSPAAITPAVDNPQAIGVMPGDVVLEVNGEKPMDFVNVAIASALAKRGEKVELVVERPAGYGVDHARLTFQIEPKQTDGSLQQIGVEPPSDLTLAAPQGDGAWVMRHMLEQSKLQAGMRLIKINEQPAHGFYEVHRAIDQSQGKPLSLSFQNGNEIVTRHFNPITSFMTNERGVPHLLGLVPPVSVTSVMPNSPADGVLQSEDILLRVGSFQLPSISQAMQEVQGAKGAIELTVLRGEEKLTVSIEPNRKGKIGVLFGYATDSNLVARVLPDSPFKSLELIAPARILSINDAPVKNYSDLRRHLESSDDALAVHYSLLFAGQMPRRESGHIQITKKQAEDVAALSWGLDLPAFERLNTIHKADSVTEAASMGMNKTWVLMIQTYQTLRGLFARTVPVKELHGPVGIAHVGTKITQRGWTYLMFFLGVISVNLAVLNFLPIPILDGGIAVLLLFEKLRGKPAPIVVQNALTILGLVLILSLVLFVTYNDIARLIHGS